MTLRNLLFGLIVAGLGLASVSAVAQPVTIEVSAIQAGHDHHTGQPIISFRVAEKYRQTLADLTSRNVGKKAALRSGTIILSASVIREPILGGSLQFSDSGWTEEQVKSLVDRAKQVGTKIELVIPYLD